MFWATHLGMTRWGEACESAPEKPLELWNYDGNQFARLVREALCELELPYLSRSAGKVLELKQQGDVPLPEEPTRQTL
jgi:anaphase-promoting complex subunit 7